MIVARKFICLLSFALKMKQQISILFVAMVLSPHMVMAQPASKGLITEYLYDSSGRLVSTDSLPGHEACRRTSLSYDSFGNVQSMAVNACGGGTSTARVSNTTYGAQASNSHGASTAGIFPVRQANALNQVEVKEFHPRFGLITKLVDANGVTTTWAYDNSGRLVEERSATGVRTRWEYKNCGVPQIDNEAAPCQSAERIGPEQAVWYTARAMLAQNGSLIEHKSFTIHDALDRVIRTQSKDFQGQVVVKDTRFNVLGLVQQESNLYRLSENNPSWTFYEYDLLGRVKRVDSADVDAVATGGRSITTYDYNDLAVVETNPAGQRKTSHYDVSGNLSKVVDHLGSETTYLHDGRGLLHYVNAAGAISRTGYDVRGRVLSIDDPSGGNRSFKYNVFDEPVSQVNGDGSVTTMTYDSLGRMTARNDSDLQSRWFYDKTAQGVSCGAGVGKLCEVTGSNGYQRIHTYDTLGRLKDTGVKTSSAALETFGRTYDPNSGRLSSQTWPTGFRIGYSYGSSGQVTAAVGGGVAGHPQTVSFSITSKNPQGNVTGFNYGNNIATEHSVDAVTGKVRRIRASLSGSAPGAVLHHSYSYDQLGNLKTRRDENFLVSEAFQYDALNRLTMHSTTGVGLSGVQNVQTLYDVSGNIKYKSDVGYYHYDSARANRLANISPTPGANWSAVGAVTQPMTGVRRLSYVFDDYSGKGQTLIDGVRMGAGNLKYSVSQDNSNGNSVVQWQNYTAFNMPKEMFFGRMVDSTLSATSTVAERTVTFVYGPEYQRIRKDVRVAANVPSHMEAGSTWYFNGDDGQQLTYEKEVKANGTVEHKHYLSAGEQLFAVYVSREGNLNGKPAISVNYLHQDHLGSVAAVTNQTGAIVEQMAYDAWGKRRLLNGNSDRLDSLYGSSTDRGFTSHEHLEEVASIHMNGRVYDPYAGRFISADPIVQDPGNLQSFNRYSYVWNNPLKYFDPSGFQAERPYIVDVQVLGYGFENTTWNSLGISSAWTQALFVPSSIVSSFFNDVYTGANGGYSVLQGRGPNIGESIGSAIGTYGWDAPLLVPFFGGFWDYGRSALAGDGLGMSYAAASIGADIFSAGSMGASARLARVSSRAAKETKTLFHYTTEAGMIGIVNSEKLMPSLKSLNPRDVRYGNGQYLSDIAPGSMSCAQLSRCFIGQPFQGQRFTNFVEIDVTGLNVVKGRDGVFVVPNEAPLDLTGRIIRSGGN